MTREGRSMRALALMMSMLLIATAIPPDTRAADAGAALGTRAGQTMVEGGGGAPGHDIDRWWGVAGAVLCGFEIRLIIRAPAVGMNPYALAAGLAACSLAALDVLTTQ